MKQRTLVLNMPGLQRALVHGDVTVAQLEDAIFFVTPTPDTFQAWYVEDQKVLETEAIFSMNDDTEPGSVAFSAALAQEVARIKVIALQGVNAFRTAIAECRGMSHGGNKLLGSLNALLVRNDLPVLQGDVVDHAPTTPPEVWGQLNVNYGKVAKQASDLYVVVY